MERTTMTNPNTIGTEKVRWNLDLMYSGLDDPLIDADVALLIEMAKKFNATYKGNLSKTLGKAISDYSEIVMLRNKVGMYLFLLQSINVAEPVVKAKMAEIDRILSRELAEYLTFFNLELVALDDMNLARLYADPIVAKHRPWIEHARIFKPHLLTESVESALSKRSPFGASSWGDFFDELEADLEIEFRGGKKTLTEVLHALTESKNAKERAELLGAISAGLKGSFSKYAAQTLYMIVGDGAVEDRERAYKHPMEVRNKSNRIQDEVVDALHNAVCDVGGPLARRFYRLKAAHLGLKKLKWSDRNAPMPFSDTTVVPFQEAITTVIDAYESFSPTLADLIRNSIEQKRIDAPAEKGRRGGAYNYSVVLPGNIPASFTFLNYLGSNRDVMTLAHELGHGVHGLLAGETQGPLMCDAPTAYAETASVFGEITTFNFLKKQLVAKGDKKSLLALIMATIDDAVNTVVRQIGFSNFERRLHGMDSSHQKWGEPKKYSVEEISAIWLETLKELYGGEGDVFTYENADLLWSYVSHFHRPFYVYGYAFGQLLTQSLYTQQSRLAERFEPLYLELLRSGNTKNAIELLDPFGLDPYNPQFWIDGINIGLGSLVQEAEDLSRELGVMF